MFVRTASGKNDSVLASNMTMNQQNGVDASIRPYYLFINHRGPDVKNTLASTISYSLCDKGLNVFFDKTEFKPGQELFSTIKEAIRTSSVHIAIFSPKYAESPWCLEELCLMLKSGGKIIPVFYHVPPADLLRLQNGKGIYASSFKKLRKKTDKKGKIRYDSEKLTEWREALKRVSNCSGLELDSATFSGDEGKLGNAILGRVMEHFIKARKKPVDALDDAVEDFKYFLSESRKVYPHVHTVGIVGISGSGKTTLAEEFYYRQQGYFDRSSFLLDVRNSFERNGLQSLQSQLLKELTGDEIKISHISNGKEILEDRLDCLSRQKSLKFLIILDDVDNRDQLDALLLKDGLLGRGSWVILTSRDRAILKLSGISRDRQYKIKPLVMEDARELLCKEAFNQPDPLPGFERLVESALSKCGGTPLFLKLIGEHLQLYGKINIEYCERELEMISEIPDILKTGFATLEEEEKQIFLDIACFFQKMSRVRPYAYGMDLDGEVRGPFRS